MATIPRYQRQGMGIQAPRVRSVTDISGLASGLERAAKVAVREGERRDRLTLMTFSNRLKQERLDELVEVQSNVKKQNAVGLTRREGDRLRDNRDVALAGLPDHLQDQGRIIYNDTSISYLGRIGTHEVGEYDSWERDQIAETGVTYNRLAVSNEVGDMESWSNQISDLNSILGPYPQQVEKFSREMTVSMFQTWASINPEATQKVLNENAGVIKNVMGDDYNQVLTAVKAGIAYKRSEDEYYYGLSQRRKRELNEETLKGGLGLYIDPSSQLTPAWVMSQMPNLSASGMNTLRSLLELQNQSSKVDITNVDWNGYYLASDYVNNYQRYGFERDQVAEYVVGMINTSITDSMGKSLLDILSKNVEYTDQQKATRKRILDSEFSNDKNVDTRIKSTLIGEFDYNISKYGNKWDTEQFDKRIDRELDIDIAEELEEFATTTFTTVPLPNIEEQQRVDRLVREFFEANPESNIPAAQVRREMLEYVRTGE